MSKMFKAGFATFAGTATLATMVLPAAFAGTGGSEYAGVIYGQDAAYCDAQAARLLKTDSLSGAPLEGAVFQVNNTSQAPQNLGLKLYTSDPSGGQLAADRIAWQEAFDKAIDTAFSATDYGKAWKKASIVMDAGQAQSTGANKDLDPTVFNYKNNTVYFPADITAITNSSSQAAAMQSWPRMAAVAGSSSTVDGFGKAVKERLDAIGKVYFTDYNPATGTGTTKNAALAGSDSEAAVLAEYNKAFAEWNNFQNAVHAAGYTIVNSDGTVNIGSFDVGTQNWDKFTAAYKAMTAKDAFAFGLVPPTYDVIANTIGNAALETAAKAADAAVKATSTASGTGISATTDASGNIWVGVFGRDLTTTATGTMDKSCAAQTITMVETAAPDGYVLDGTPQVAPMSNVEDTMAKIEMTNVLEKVGVDPDIPTPPQFESGL